MRYITNNYGKVQYTLVFGLILFPILPKIAESIIMIAMAIISILYISWFGNQRWNHLKFKQLFITSAVFLVLMFSTLYSSNLNASQKYIVQYLPLLTIPIFFLSRNTIVNNRKRLKILITVYIVGICFLLTFINAYFFRELYIQKIDLYNFRVKTESLIDVHGTYLSMWIGFGVVLLISQIRNINKFSINIIFFILIVYFTYWLVIINARMPMLATIVASLLLVALKLNLSFKRLLALSIIGLTGSGIMFQQEITSKFKVLLNYENALPIGKYENNFPTISSEHIRSGVYYCSFKIISNNVLIGVGIGDVDDLLQSCYDKEFYYTDVFKIIKYNSHSQYLLVLLSTGIVGFFIFLISFYLMLQTAIRKSSYLYFCFLIFVGLCFCFENILSRHDGVVFFSLFNSILFFYQDDVINT